MTLPPHSVRFSSSRVSISTVLILVLGWAAFCLDRLECRQLISFDRHHHASVGHHRQFFGRSHRPRLSLTQPIQKRSLSERNSDQGEIDVIRIRSFDSKPHHRASSAASTELTGSSDDGGVPYRVSEVDAADPEAFRLWERFVAESGQDDQSEADDDETEEDDEEEEETCAPDHTSSSSSPQVSSSHANTSAATVLIGQDVLLGQYGPDKTQPANKTGTAVTDAGTVPKLAKPADERDSQLAKQRAEEAQEKKAREAAKKQLEEEEAHKKISGNQKPEVNPSGNQEQAGKAEVDRKAKEQAEKAEADRKAKEQAEKAEADRKAKVQADKVEADRKAKEQAGKAEADRKAKELVDKAEADRKAKEQQAAEQAAKSKAAAAPKSTSDSSSGGSSGSGGYSGDATFYATGLGSCGITDKDENFIVAVSHELYDSFQKGGDPNSNPVCGKKIKATYKGNFVEVTVHDRCEGCMYGDLDFSPAAFDKLGSKDEGRLHGMTWSFSS